MWRSSAREVRARFRGPTEIAFSDAAIGLFTRREAASAFAPDPSESDPGGFWDMADGGAKSEDVLRFEGGRGR